MRPAPSKVDGDYLARSWLSRHNYCNIDGGRIMKRPDVAEIPINLRFRLSRSIRHLGQILVLEALFQLGSSAIGCPHCVADNGS